MRSGSHRSSYRLAYATDINTRLMRIILQTVSKTYHSLLCDLHASVRNQTDTPCDPLNTAWNVTRWSADHKGYLSDFSHLHVSRKVRNDKFCSRFVKLFSLTWCWYQFATYMQVWEIRQIPLVICWPSSNISRCVQRILKCYDNCFYPYCRTYWLDCFWYFGTAFGYRTPYRSAISPVVPSKVVPGRWE